MRRRLRVLGLVAGLLCGVAIASGGAASSGALTARREPAVIATRAHAVVAPLTTRTGRDRLPPLVAVLAALVLVAAGSSWADRPRSSPRRVEVASLLGPSRAPPPIQNLAF
jgi:hypothetical protein